MTVYFCWERANFGDWQPVCYHGEQPRPVKISDGDPPFRSPVHEVPDGLVAADGTPNFGRLAKKFPAPGGAA
jgi:hypothetical protein